MFASILRVSLRASRSSRAAAAACLGRPSSAASTPLRGIVARAKSEFTADTVLECVGNGDDRRSADGYHVTDEEIEAYHRDGYISLPGVCTQEEVDELEVIYNKCIHGEVAIPGKDFCDMSQGYNVPFEQWRLVNAMLPRVYYPPLTNNVYERRCADIVRQLFDSNSFGIDYDQFLAKKPQRDAAVFAWHQDLAYWPVTDDTRTATFSLAFDATTLENGCLNFVSGSHREEKLRNHRPFAENLQVRLNDDDKITAVPIPRGGVSIHNEKVLHGSGGNFTDGWRRTYVVAFRTTETIAWERENGFTHSHNDDFNWDKFHSWQDTTHGTA